MKKSAIDEIALVPLVEITKLKMEGPTIIPPKISPITEGQQICSKSSPTRSAAIKTINMSEIMANAKIALPKNNSRTTLF